MLMAFYTLGMCKAGLTRTEPGVGSEWPTELVTLCAPLCVRIDATPICSKCHFWLSVTSHQQNEGTCMLKQLEKS